MFLSPLPFLPFLVAVDGLRISFSSITPPKSSNRLANLLATCSDSSCGQLGNIQDSIYVSDIVVGGQQYNVLLDTGSADLWVNASLLPPKTNTIIQNLIVSEVYGDQSNYTGPIAFAEVEFHGFTVANQSFTAAMIAENDNTAALNVTGLIGLSFNGLSLVQQTVAKATGSNTAGQTFLSNVFAANTSLSNFITFFLSRDADLNSTANTGVFTVSEVEKGFEGIDNAPQVDLFPANNEEWTVPIDSITVNGNDISLGESVVSTSSSVKSVGLLDTGTSNIIASSTLVNQIYSQISGAQRVGAGGGTSIYILPCSTVPPTVEISIGGQKYPIHPLDINTVGGVWADASGNQVSVCFGGLLASQPLQGRFDVLLGSPFLRNAYTMFDYGASSTSPTASGPFVKLLSVTSSSAASSDFTATRNAQLKLAPQASASQITAILNGDPSFTPVNTPDVSGGGGGGGGSGGSGGGSGSGSSSPKSSGTKFSLTSGLLAVPLALSALLF